MKLMLDATPFNQKPGKTDVEGRNGISVRLGKSPADVTVHELREAIEKGQTHAAGYFEGGRKNQCWVSQEVFELDFDEGITIEEFDSIVSETGITPFLVYKSFSFKPEHHKFRALFRMNTVITDMRVRTLVYNALFNLFDKKADKQCKDAARLFYGTNHKDSTFNPDAMVDIMDLISAMTERMSITDSKNFARDMKTFCQACAIHMVDSFPMMARSSNDEEVKGPDFEENTGSLILYTIGFPADSSKNGSITQSTSLNFWFAQDEESFRQTRTNSKGAYTEKKTKDVQNHKSTWVTREKIDLNEIPNVCELAREFETGSRYLPKNERRLLMSNYIQLKGGEQRFMDAMDQHEDYDLEFRKDVARKEIREHKAYGYKPTSCNENDCPFFHSCPNRRTNILLKLETKRGEVKRIDPLPQMKTQAQAEAELKQIMTQAYSKQGEITVVKAPTGIGKTKVMTELPLKNTMIAVPTHALREELYVRLQQEGHNFLNVYERPAFPRQSDEDQYMMMISRGAYSEAGRLVFAVAHEYQRQPVHMTTPEEVAICKYAETLKEMKHRDNLLVTHKRLLQVENRLVEQIIIDEDILLGSLMAMNTIHISDFYTLCGTFAQNQQITQILNGLHKDLHDSSKKNVIQQLPTVALAGISKQILDAVTNTKVQFGGNIIEFLESDHFIVTDDRKRGGLQIHSIKKIDLRELFPTQNIIIMSATANELMYKKMFGNNINFVDMGAVQMAGKIVPHYERSFSRSSIAKMNKDGKLNEVYQGIKKETGNANVITYKGYRMGAEAAGLNVVATFGATAGLDQYKGQDLAVIGTPHVDNTVYVLMAKALGVKVTMLDQNDVTYELVHRNGYEFYFNTYSKNPMLREIQFALIESELIQAIGRARALRHNCTVHVYSNLPIY